MTQNMTQAEDLRVRRTRKLLRQALIELTIEKGFAAVTVQDIAERAMVNRATFYRHYLDKYDLLDQYTNEVYDDTASEEPLPAAQVSGPAQEAPPDGPPVGLVRLLAHMRANAEFYRVMLSEKGDPTFARRIREHIEARLRALLPEETMRPRDGGPPLDLCLSYVSHACVGALVWWLEQPAPCAPEDMARWLSQFNQADVRLALEGAPRPQEGR
jgi:AcrR family transcriptional regulator